MAVRELMAIGSDESEATGHRLKNQKKARSKSKKANK